MAVDRNSRGRFPSWNVARQIAQNEGTRGTLRAFYRGLTPNLVGNSLGWSTYFLFYRQAQDLLHKVYGHNEVESKAPLSSGEYLLTSAAAGTLSSVLLNPLWVIKTRMLSTGSTHVGAYRSMTSGLKSLLVNEGLKGYTRGLIPALAGVSHGALYFVAYEKLKQIRAKSNNGDMSSLTNTEYLGISGLAKVWAGALTYPHQVVRARLQMYTNQGIQYNGVMDVVKRVWLDEGILGYYKGLGPNLIRVVPSTCVTFIIYENIKWSLSQPLKDRKLDY